MDIFSKEVIRLNSEEKTVLLKVFRLGKMSDYHLINKGIINNNFLVRTREQDYVFRLYGTTYGLEDVKFETSLLSFLTGKFKVPRLIKTTSGESYTILNDKIISCLEYCVGEERTSEEKIVDSDLFDLGNTLSEYHAIIHDFKPESKRTFDEFKKCREIRYVNEILYPRIETTLHDTNDYDLVTNYLKKLKITVDSISKENIKLKEILPVHGDLSIGNIKFVNGKINCIIDFDSSHMSEPIYDVASASLYWSIINSRLDENKLGKLLNGYFSKERTFIKNPDRLPTIMKWICWGFCNFWLHAFLFRNIPSNEICKSNLVFFMNKLNQIDDDTIHHVIDGVQ